MISDGFLRSWEAERPPPESYGEQVPAGDGGPAARARARLAAGLRRHGRGARGAGPGKRGRRSCFLLKCEQVQKYAEIRNHANFGGSRFGC